MGLRSKKDVSKLKEKFLKEKEKKTSGGNSDKRFLNYYDLDFGEKMVIRFLPDADGSGDYWKEYSVHGPGLKIRGLESINCAWTSSGDECPACQYSFDYYNDGDKKEATRWRRSERYVGQVLVVDSPIEINESEDGNPIKLMYIPYGVKTLIEEAVIEGIIGEDENIFDYEFVLKKTENAGGNAEYSKSYFNQKSEPLDDEIVDAIDRGEIQLYEISKEIPEPTSTEDVEEWLEKAIEADSKMKSRRSSTRHETSSNDSSDDDDNDEKESSPRKNAKELLAKLNKNKNK